MGAIAVRPINVGRLDAHHVIDRGSDAISFEIESNIAIPLARLRGGGARGHKLSRGELVAVLWHDANDGFAKYLRATAHPLCIRVNEDLPSIRRVLRGKVARNQVLPVADIGVAVVGHEKGTGASHVDGQ